MLSIGLIGHGAGAADYYVARQAGCPLDYYTGSGNAAEVGSDPHPLRSP